ncbi:MAG: aspartate--tRNA(Asn) ligase [Thaumarchaeota archaeon]|nr:aspartate--tRNA(Asn) ligase [Nitrososphaerota archaeon]MCL5316806.1 aspartate--tRNA(Asn) ligase [Nitrososphaerota archaeon]
MVKIDELGDWRRTHRSVDLSPKLEGEKVTVMGWVSSIRRQGGIIFLILQDSAGVVQVTVKSGKTPEPVLKRVETLTPHSVVAVKGTVKAIDKAPNGAEVIPEEMHVLNIATKNPPFSLFGGELPNIDKRLDIRSLELRRPKAQAIFKIRHAALAAIREFLSSTGHLEVQTSKIIASATEGGASLFPVLYYDKEAFLVQSPQLYKEQLTMSFEKVFEIGPVFRAEPSRTLRHLAEIISIDVEEAYVSYTDVMETLEELVHHTMKTVAEKCRSDLKELGVEVEIPRLPFKRLTYSEAIDILYDAGDRTAWGEDISTAATKKISEIFPGFYFITDWPTDAKPFYIKPRTDKPEISESFDLMKGSLEISSGGTRLSSKKLLTKRLKEQGLKPRTFEYHLKLFDYGMPPHAGFGMGLDRLMMVITKEENIREVTLFPRDRLRLSP